MQKKGGGGGLEPERGLLRDKKMREGRWDDKKTAGVVEGVYNECTMVIAEVA